MKFYLDIVKELSGGSAPTPEAHAPESWGWRDFSDVEEQWDLVIITGTCVRLDE